MSEKPPEKRASKPARGSKSSRPSPLLFLSAGIEFTAVTAALALIGWWLDGKAGTDPWLMIVGMAMGLIGGTYKLWKAGKRFFNN